jgi:hypothetical protein
MKNREFDADLKKILIYLSDKILRKKLYKKNWDLAKLRPLKTVLLS